MNNTELMQIIKNAHGGFQSKSNGITTIDRMINPASSNKQYVRPKLKQSGDFYIMDKLLDYGKDGRKANEEYLESFIRMIKYNITENYTKVYHELPPERSGFIDKINEFTRFMNDNAKDSQAVHDQIFGYGIKIRDNAKLIKERYHNQGHTISLKAHNATRSIYFTYVNKGGDGDQSDIFIAAYDSIRKIAIAYMMGVNPYVEDINQIIDSNILSPIYITPKTRYIEDCVRDPNFSNDTFLYGVIIIDAMLRFYVEDCECGKYFDRYQKSTFIHSPFEMTITNRLFNTLDGNLKNVVSLSSRVNQRLISRSIDPNTYYGSVEDVIMEHHVPDIVINPQLDAPVIDFSEKEVNFIRKFLAQYKIFDDNGEKELIMSEVFKNPRYGKVLIMPSIKSNGESAYTFLSYEYDEKKDQVEFTISYRCNDNFTIFVTYAYCNVSDPNWNLAESMMSRKIHLYRHTQAQWPSSLEGVYEIVPSLFNSETALTNLLQDLLDFFTIIYLRPDRSKVIRETTRIEVPDDRVIRRNKNNRSHATNTTRQEFAVRRILKDTKAAKEYISKMVTEGAPNREYTLEEWDRKGYHRKKPHSEETIWIEPTKCHRRLPLSDKEVHIKL